MCFVVYEAFELAIAPNNRAPRVIEACKPLHYDKVAIQGEGHYQHFRQHNVSVIKILF